MKSICVFCGANKGMDPVYAEMAYQTGKFLARQGIKLIYGAGRVGLMGVMADAALEHGGQVAGVIPHFLKKKELCHENLSELFLVGSMNERKLKMMQLSDGVLTLPGGYGTLDELFEMVTLVQLRQVDIPIGLLNVKGFYDPLIRHLDRMTEEGFLRRSHRDIIAVSGQLEELLDLMQTRKNIDEEKWMER